MKKKLITIDPSFWPSWFSKLLFTLISVKVWGLVVSTSISTWLLLLNYRSEPLVIGEQVIEHGINGAQWVTFNTTVWALIFGMKEIFRIAEHRDVYEKESLELEAGSRIRLAGLLKKKPDNKVITDMDKEFEFVGPEVE